MSAVHPLVELVEQASDALPELTTTVRVADYSWPKSGGTAQTWTFSRGKRIFDICVSLAVLTLGGIPMLFIGWLIRITSSGPAIFIQTRLGQGGRPFSIYKFRTMHVEAATRGIRLTKSGDDRITWIGNWLRRFKLDELPQFYNVLRGDMSVVGPRPKLPEYADNESLAYRPGITGAASLIFRREEELLASIPKDQIESFYHSRIKPQKASIDSHYMSTATLTSDLRVILSTATGSLFLGKSYLATQSSTIVDIRYTPIHISESESSRKTLHFVTEQDSFGLD